MQKYNGTLVVDIDGTLCPIKTAEENYSDIIPYAPIVDKLRRLQEQGFRILLFTARNMRTYQGNLGEINKYTAPMTIDWLERNHIPYDEIIFGKPWPGKDGLCIDDRTVRPVEFLNKSIEELKEIMIADRKFSQTSPATEIVITMAGEGTRFKKEGYTDPKHHIKAKGLPLFMWSMLSLTDFIRQGSRFIFVIRDYPNEQAFLSKYCSILGIRDFDTVILNKLTDGQATTAYMAKNIWTPNAPLAIYNIDTYIEPDAMRIEQIRGDGWIPCFNAPGEHWSFVKLGMDGWASQVREKEKISNNCSIGMYWFSSAALYEQTYLEYYAKVDNIVMSEKYIAPLYNHMIRKGKKVSISEIPSNMVHVLGTPEEIHTFVTSVE